MSRDPYLHELAESSDLFRIVADERGILPQLIEKDYWIMHCLYGLAKQGFEFELKGGTSLSKGFGIIQRFSEDIDIHISPACAPFYVDGNTNHKKPDQIQSRKDFYDWLADYIAIDGITDVQRDTAFDDERYRSGGIRLHYDSRFEETGGLKQGILLEVGFDDTAPNNKVTISSWVFDKATEASARISDNRAIDIQCYHPGYTFVEKLQTVSTKFRKQQESGAFPANFLRHYYDLSQLLEHPDVQAFIGTEKYHKRKAIRFRAADNQNIAENEAFLIRDPEVRELYRNAFQATQSLYFDEQPAFDVIIEKIQAQLGEL